MEPITIKLYSCAPYGAKDGDAYFVNNSLNVYYQGQWRRTMDFSDIHQMVSSRQWWSNTHREFQNTTIDQIIEILFTLVSAQWGFETKKELEDILESIKLSNKLEKE